MPDLTMRVYTDGTEPHAAWGAICSGWSEAWHARYATLGTLRFDATRDMTADAVRATLPPRLAFISDLRNPDLFFEVAEHRLEFAGLEFTTHAPDGSNIDKRVPLLWAARRYGVHGFLLTPYAKQRSGGAQINRIPGRIGTRNLHVLAAHPISDPEAGLTLTIPSRELQEGDLQVVPPAILEHLMTNEEIGALLAHLLAARIAPGNPGVWQDALESARGRLRAMSQACVDAATREVVPRALFKENSRWIQVYNARPETGHWERGEGQFDSIDARLMVTLDEIDLLPATVARPRLEFWLPQLVSGHPWVREQRDNDFRSKRFGNIVRVLRADVLTKFADHLTPGDWSILEANPRLRLERLDWPVGIYRIADLVLAGDRSRVVAPVEPTAQRDAVMELLARNELHYASHRAYEAGWADVLAADLRSLTPGAVVLAPRLPGTLVEGVAMRDITLLPGEQCTKEHLLMIRQIEHSGLRPRTRHGSP